MAEILKSTGRSCYMLIKLILRRLNTFIVKSIILRQYKLDISTDNCLRYACTWSLRAGFNRCTRLHDISLLNVS